MGNSRTPDYLKSARQNQSNTINPGGSGALYSPLESYTNCGREGADPSDKHCYQKIGAARAAPKVKRFVVCLDYFPVPDRAILCGLFGALSLIVTAPVSGPAFSGVKVTLM